MAAIMPYTKMARQAAKISTRALRQELIRLILKQW
jgi:hypothetical protein